MLGLWLCPKNGKGISGNTITFLNTYDLRTKLRHLLKASYDRRKQGISNREGISNRGGQILTFIRNHILEQGFSFVYVENQGK